MVIISFGEDSAAIAWQVWTTIVIEMLNFSYTLRISLRGIIH